MQKITTFLTFNDQAEAAVNRYVSLFKNAAIEHVTRCGPNGPFPEGTVLLISFRLNGQQYMALNGGPNFKFTEAFSLMVSCDTQEEIDHYWEGLLADGGRTKACGWLEDPYGVSWQIVPAQLGDWMSAREPERAERVMQAVWQMIKLDIATLQAAYDGNV